MKKTLFKVLLGIVLACILYISFLFVKYNNGVTAKNLESDIRTEQHIDDAWIVDGSISDTMAAFISYPEDRSDHVFSVYIKHNDLSLGYFFREGGSLISVQDGIGEFRIEGYNEQAFISMNHLKVSRLEADVGNTMQVIAIDSNKPFAIVLPVNAGNITFYDTDGTAVEYETPMGYNAGSVPKTKGIPTLIEVEHMRDGPVLSEAFHGLTKAQLRAAWGEPERSDETYPLDVWTFEDSDLELVIIYDSDDVITKWYFGIE